MKGMVSARTRYIRMKTSSEHQLVSCFSKMEIMRTNDTAIVITSVRMAKMLFSPVRITCDIRLRRMNVIGPSMSNATGKRIICGMA
jgi:hypothetical protein